MSPNHNPRRRVIGGVPSHRRVCPVSGDRFRRDRLHAGLDQHVQAGGFGGQFTRPGTRVASGGRESRAASRNLARAPVWKESGLHAMHGMPAPRQLRPDALARNRKTPTLAGPSHNGASRPPQFLDPRLESKARFRFGGASWPQVTHVHRGLLVAMALGIDDAASRPSPSLGPLRQRSSRARSSPRGGCHPARSGRTAIAQEELTGGRDDGLPRPTTDGRYHDACGVEERGVGEGRPRPLA